MCEGVVIIWRCRRCSGKVLLDNSKYQIPCAARMGHLCPVESFTWRPAIYKCAGTDVDPRESLTDPNRGSSFLKFNEFYCISCEMDIFELPRLSLHADSRELEIESSVDGNNNASPVAGEASEISAFASWREAERQMSEDGQPGQQRWWYSLIPVDRPNPAAPTVQNIAKVESTARIGSIDCNLNGNGASTSFDVDDNDDEDNQNGGAKLW